MNAPLNPDREQQPRKPAPEAQGELSARSGEGAGAVLSQRIGDALATLTEVKKFVVCHRFGLGGAEQLSYEEIAHRISAKLGSECRQALAEREGVRPEEVTITAEKVKLLLTEALRDLRSSGTKSGGLS
jgi:DNA-directed RNA polymerase sigma subunit (sigma70/sigma32)